MARQINTARRLLARQIKTAENALKSPFLIHKLSLQFEHQFYIIDKCHRLRRIRSNYVYHTEHSIVVIFI